MTRCSRKEQLNASSSPDTVVRIGGIGTVSGRAPLAPGGLPGFTGPFPSTSLDKGVCNWQVRPHRSKFLISAQAKTLILRLNKKRLAFPGDDEVGDAESSQRGVLDQVHSV